MNHDPDRGKYREILDEKELLHTTVKEPRCVVHFYHKDFRRCHILDRHLEHLARQHPGTLFVKANVERTPFLVEKLGIRVLPCVMAFDHGVCKDRLIGFEEFGNSDQFSTAALEWRLGRVGMWTYGRRQLTARHHHAAAAPKEADPGLWRRRHGARGPRRRLGRLRRCCGNTPPHKKVAGRMEHGS